MNKWFSSPKLKNSNERSSINAFSIRNTLSPSPRMEILEKIRESVFTSIKKQNICLEEKIKMREVKNRNSNEKLFQSEKIDLKREINQTLFKSIDEREKEKINFEKDLFNRESQENNQNFIEDPIQFEKLEEVYKKVKELFNDHNRKEKLWKIEKNNFQNKILYLENRIRYLEKQIL